MKKKSNIYILTYIFKLCTDAEIAIAQYINQKPL